MNILVKNEVCTPSRQFSDIPRLTVIVPFRNDPSLPYLLDRLEGQCRSLPRHDSIEFIVIDSGSDFESRIRAQEICNRHGVRYIYHDSGGQVFSIGAARDYGVTHAKGRAVTFLDVDCRAQSDFWDRLLALMHAVGISRYKSTFFVVPCLYLTQEGTDAFLSRDEDDRFTDMYIRWLHGDKENVQNMAPCSSMMVVDRLHYLSVGGHRAEFRGHGFEDFELYHRLIGHNGTLPRPTNYFTDSKTWDTATFNGFRSQFALLGRAAHLMGLFIVHLWHPRPKTVDFYSSVAMKTNRDAWISLFQEFDKTGEHPSPLIDSAANERPVLIFGQPKTNATRCLRDVLPYLGRPVYMSELEFIDNSSNLLEEDLIETLSHHGIERILFHNPYGNEARLKIYKWCKRSRFPHLVFERGALPDSWFFDPRGFNADSGSYKRKLWDKPLRVDQIERVKAYIFQCLHEADSLERQGSRIGGDALKEKLGIGGKKVLFVPFQRPSDAVIRHMAGPAKNFEAFVAAIEEAAKALRKAGWIVLCKKHPLETASPHLVNAQYVPDDTHFLDLLEAADAVALINSGVGIYAMMMGKPCYIFGDAFYAFDGINTKIPKCSANELRNRILNNKPIDIDLAYRFIHYLVVEFYSFGRSKTSSRKEADGSLRNVTTSIDFYDIKLPGVPRKLYDPSAVQQIQTSAPIFERYQLDLHQRNELLPVSWTPR